MVRNISRNPFYGVLKEYEHWVVLFRDKQVTIGSVIVMSKQLNKESLGDVTVEGWAEFGKVCADVERWLKTAFGAEKFNYLALMMVDAEVHFHVIPRYSKPVQFAGREFIDPDWPGATKRIAMELDADIRAKIEAELIKVATT